MKTLHYLFNPDLAPLYWPGMVAGIAIALLAAPLSVIVVLKRLAFIGQGVSHAAFGGLGVSVLIAAIVGIDMAQSAGSALQLGIVLLFCLGSGFVIVWLGRKKSTPADTAIGIVLVVSMAIGAVLVRIAAQINPTRAPAWESVLFGSIFEIAGMTALITSVVAAGVLVTLWHQRRPVMLWTFDEASAPAFGVESERIRLLLMVLLTLAVVVSMKLAGVVLATALLVLPGAAGLVASSRVGPVFLIASVTGIVGVVGGLVLSFELDWPPGPSIVLILGAAYLLARVGALGRKAA